METAKDFEEVRVGLNNQIMREVKELKTFLYEADFTEDEIPDKVIERIFYAADGLNKLL